MNDLPIILVISLKDSLRKNVIAKRLNDLNIRFEFIDAVYGKSLPQEVLDSIDYTFYQEFDNKTLTLGEIGCSLSHIKAYTYMKEHNISQAIILEDDAMITPFFKQIVLDCIKKLPKRYEILFLDHGKAKSYPFIKRTLPEGYKLVRYRYPSQKSRRSIMRTTAYMINLAGVDKLLKVAYPVRMPADFLTGFIQWTQINAYGIEPPCVFGGIDSEIDAIQQRD